MHALEVRMLTIGALKKMNFITMEMTVGGGGGGGREVLNAKLFLTRTIHLKVL